MKVSNTLIVNNSQFSGWLYAYLMKVVEHNFA
jgi:hypothetical protein